MIRLDKSSPVGVSKHLDPVIAHALSIEKNDGRQHEHTHRRDQSRALQGSHHSIDQISVLKSLTAERFQHLYG